MMTQQLSFMVDVTELALADLLRYIAHLRQEKRLPQTLRFRPRGWSDAYRRYPRRLALERWARLLKAYENDHA